MPVSLKRDEALSVAKRMLTMRRFEEKVYELAQHNLLLSIYHLYIGQEAAGTAILEALGPDDKIVSNHRNHGHIVGRGADLGRSMAELLGRATGLVGGRGGSFHLCDPALGFLETSAVLGGNISLATGAGYGLRRRKQKSVVAVFFGDGSLEEGVAYEALNVAAMLKLPVLYILENNNLGALGLHQGGLAAANTSVRRFTQIPELYGITTRQFTDGNDVAGILAATREAIAQCHAGEGPVFIEIATRRWPGGNSIMPQLVTGVTDLAMAWGDRPITGEHASWIEQHDPLIRLARDLVGAGIVTKAEFHALDRDICGRVDAAAKFAVDSPFPEPRSAFDHVFA
jgi:pyruvate dehydrogenase E1 component alpha subunit